MIEEIVSHDEHTLVKEEGGSGYIYDCDGNIIMRVPSTHMMGVEVAFPTVIAMYRLGHRHGEITGKHEAQWAMRKALGL